MSNNVMALDKALYKGHAIAAVAATSAHAAEQALELIDVDYEVLTPVTDAREAMKPGAPHPSPSPDEHVQREPSPRRLPQGGRRW